MTEPLTSTPSSRIALLACAVFEREVAMLVADSGRVAESCFLEIGLHDRPELLRKHLQQELDRVDSRDDISAIVLAYGLCGRGTDGLRSGRHPLVIARGHDCITHFLGSKERYSELQAQCPQAYYYTPAWNRARRVPSQERLEALRADYAARFDPDEVDFLLETERALWAGRDRAIFLDMGTRDAGAEAVYAKGCADWLGWSFQRMPSNPSLLRDLIFGPWDETRFQLVQPGQVLRFTCSPEIFKAESPS
jgi:hypothetical protein